MRWIALPLLLALPALAGEQAPPADAPARYLDVVTVGCAPPSNGELVYVWHTKLPGIDDVKTMRMFKYLESPKFEGCLSAIAKTKPDLYEKLLALRPDAIPEDMGATLQRAYDAWAEYGAERALQEAAETGALGPETDRFYERCSAISADASAPVPTQGPAVIIKTPEPYLDIVSVALAAPEAGQLAYVWNTHAPHLYDTEVAQAVRTIDGPRFEGCLSAIAKTRPGLYEALLDLRTDTVSDTRNAVLRRARGVWYDYGAHLALEEAAKTGKTGPETKAFFDRCDVLLHGTGRNKL